MSDDGREEFAKFVTEQCDMGIHRWPEWSQAGEGWSRTCVVCKHTEERDTPPEALPRQPYDPYRDL